ncbi:HAD-IB family phosphatase [bacterium]|nr:HAD-IB family phosphatase [bacterium]
MKTAYFVDFDFTISNGDIWDAIVKYFAPNGWKQVVNEYLEGKINSRQYNERVAAMIQPREPEVRELVLSMGIDPTFHDFTTWLDTHQYPITIVSDGYDYYIDLLLSQAGLEHLPVFCNRMVWHEDGIEVEFPLHKEDCEIGMAHCKCQHFAKFPGMRHVYIGDGVSDICAATKSHHIYAKRNLLDYCVENKISHTPFEHFLHIIEHEEKQPYSTHSTGESHE